MNYPKREREIDPVPLTDSRFPGLFYVDGDPEKPKHDPASKNRIASDDSQFNIFSTANINYNLESVRKSLIQLPPFKDYTQGVLELDIETIGIEFGKNNEIIFTDKAEIVAIGLKFNGRHYIACNPLRSELDLLNWLINQLNALPGCHSITGFNIYGFDLYVIEQRLEAHGLGHLCPWHRRGGDWPNYRWNNAIVFGRPLEMPAWVSDRYQLIDLYPQVVIQDGLTRKLDSYSLKEAVLGWGLRDSRRVEIGGQIDEYWEKAKSGDSEALDLIKEYLAYDLDDTELLWQFLIPQRYFLGQYMNWTLEKLLSTGTGSWWNAYLRGRTQTNPNPMTKCAYQGALTYYIAGLYQSGVKFDFASLYPSMQLVYGIGSRKDKRNVMLQTLAFQKAYRIELKKIAAETGDKDAEAQQNSAKVGLNSGYGMLGVAGLGFNDMYAAAAVTAYGRQCARYMIQFLLDRGISTHGVDTDGVYSVIDDWSALPTEWSGLPDTTENRQAYYKAVHKELNASLPEGVSADYELDYDLLWIPETTANIKRASEALRSKVEFLGNNSGESISPGLSKNYVMFGRDKKGKRKVTLKGKFKKRNQTWLVREFPKRFLELFLDEGVDAANDFYLTTRRAIADGTFPVEQLQQKVLVAANWKAFPSYGFPIGSKPTIHYVWRGDTEGKKKIKKVFIPSDNPTEAYAPEYYLEALDKIRRSIQIPMPMLGGLEADSAPASLPESVSDQLALFAFV